MSENCLFCKIKSDECSYHYICDVDEIELARPINHPSYRALTHIQAIEVKKNE